MTAPESPITFPKTPVTLFRNTHVADWLLDHRVVRFAEAASADPLPEFLSVSETKHLITFSPAFAQWMVKQRAMGSLRQPASIGVYQDMWRAFTVWCLGQSPVVTLDTLDLRDLQAFHAARFGRES